MILNPFDDIWEVITRKDPHWQELGMKRIKEGPRGLDTEEDMVAFHAARHISYWAHYIHPMAVKESKQFGRMIKGDEVRIWEFLKNTLGIEDRIHWRLFVKYKPKDPHYDLSRFTLKEGYVELPTKRLERFAEEVFRKRYLELSNPWPDARIMEPVQRTLKSAAGKDPPCIKRLMERLNAGENLPHIARWVLAVYLLHRHKSVDEIVKIFEPAPDYNPKITRYYVEHAKRKGYKMPSCNKMKSYGLCPGDCGRHSPLDKGKPSYADKRGK